MVLPLLFIEPPLKQTGILTECTMVNVSETLNLELDGDTFDDAPNYFSR